MKVRDLFLAVGVEADTGHIDMPVLVRTWEGAIRVPQKAYWDESRKAFVISLG